MANCEQIIIDTIDNCDAEYSTEGWKATRVFIVKGIEGSGGFTKLSNAIVADDGVNSVPNIWDPIVDGSLLLLQSIRPEAIDSETIKLTLTYADYTIKRSSRFVKEVPFQETRTSVRISASLGQEQTTKDKDGNDVELSYTYPSDYIWNDSCISKTVTVIPQVSIPVPQKVITLSRRMTTSANALESVWESYGGKVNSSAWRNGTARTWLFSGMDATPNEDNTQWDVQYQFQYKRDGWDSTEVFIDPNTGKAPDDLDSNSEKTSERIKEADFGSISI